MKERFYGKILGLVVTDLIRKKIMVSIPNIQTDRFTGRHLPSLAAKNSQILYPTGKSRDACEMNIFQIGVLVISFLGFTEKTNVSTEPG